MKKALISLDLENFDSVAFAKALDLARIQEKHIYGDGFPHLCEADLLYCRAVFREVIDLLEYYSDLCEEV